MFSTLILIIATWVFIGFVFVGLGLLAPNIYVKGIKSFSDVLDAFWLGLAFLVFFLQWWNFFFPINSVSFFLPSIVSAIVIAWRFRLFYSLFSRGNIFLMIITLVTAIYLAGMASFPFFREDHGAYYAAMVQWAHDYPVIKGIGNLYGALAFNNAYYLYAAWGEALPWIKKSHHFVTGVLFMGLLTQIFFSYLKLMRSDKLRLADVYYLLMLWPVIFFIQTSRLGSPSADSAILIIQIILVGKLFDLNEENYLFICILCILGVCIKVSMLPLAVSLIVLGGIGLTAEKQKVSKGLIVCLLLGLLPCLVRNVLASGYIFYPMSFGGFPVAWQIPQAQALWDWHGVVTMARLGQMHWVMPWLRENWQTPFSFKIPVVIFALALLAIILRHFIDHKKFWPKNSWLLISPIIISLVIWFMTAPTMRFAGALFWILAVVLVIIACEKWRGSGMFFKIICSLSFLSTVCYFGFEAYETIDVTRNNAHNMEIHHLQAKGLLGPALNDIFYDLHGPVQYTWYLTNSGFRVYTSNTCWDMIPCTPNFDPNLRLMGEGLSSGFSLRK